MNNIISFVPIRSGSKGIKDKNIKKINHRPLVYWVLSALQQSKVNKIIVAIDSEEYKLIIKKFQFNKIIFYDREHKNAQDNSTTEDAILEYLGKGYENNEDVFILVQATNPLLNYKDVNKMIDEYEKGSYNSMLSVADLNHRFLWTESFSHKYQKSRAIPLNYDFKSRPLRQEKRFYKNNIYMENGAMYINTISNIIKSKNRLTDPVGLFIMDYYTHFEIDVKTDFRIVELLLKEKFK